MLSYDATLGLRNTVIMKGDNTQTDGKLLSGVPEPYHVRARESVECAVMVITKARFDGVLHHYPEQNDVVLTNLLYVPDLAL